MSCSTWARSPPPLPCPTCPRGAGTWRWTRGVAAPADLVEPADQSPFSASRYPVRARSVVVLEGRQDLPGLAHP